MTKTLSPIKEAWQAAEREGDEMPQVTPKIIATELRDLAKDLRQLEDAQFAVSHHAIWLRKFRYDDQIIEWGHYEWLIDQGITDLIDRLEEVANPQHHDSDIAKELAELIEAVNIKGEDSA